MYTYRLRVGQKQFFAYNVAAPPIKIHSGFRLGVFFSAGHSRLSHLEKIDWVHQNHLFRLLSGLSQALSPRK